MIKQLQDTLVDDTVSKLRKVLDEMEEEFTKESAFLKGTQMKTGQNEATTHVSDSIGKSLEIE